MNCKWCNKEMNGANDYQLAGFCNLSCRNKGGDSDKIDLISEINNPLVNVAAPPVEVEAPKAPKRRREKPVVQDQIPDIQDFFNKAKLKG